ncbi:MAG: RNA polymerase sigma factor [Bacteroidota bacterium]
MQSEQELISNLCAGDENAFRELFNLYADKVYNTALSMLQNQQDAEDITQEVFVEVYRSINKFKGESQLYTWIYRIAISKCTDQIKKQKTKKRFSFLTSLFGDDNTLIHDRPHFEHPGVLAEKKEDSKALFHAIAKLPEKQQSAYTLHKIEQLSQKEVAEVMQTTPSAVESLIGRANENLRRLLSEYYNNTL